MFGVEIINALIGWVALFVVARNMGPSALGEIAYALSLVGGFTFLAYLGFRNAHIKRVSEGKNLAKCIGTFLVVQTALLSLMLIAFGIFYWSWTSILDKHFYDVRIEVLLSILAYYVIIIYSGIMKDTFTGLQQGAKVAITNLIAEGSRAIIMIFTALFAWKVIWLANAYLIGAILATFFMFWYFKDYSIEKTDRDFVNSYVKYAVPLALLSIVGIVNTFFDKIIVGIFWTETEVGQYYAVQRIALFLGTIALSLEYMLLPAVSRIHQEKSEGLSGLIHRSERYTLMVTMPVVVVVYIFSSDIIRILLSNDFVDASRALQLLVLGSLIMISNRPWSIALRGADRPDITSVIGILSTISSLVLMLYLVPKEIPHLGLYNLPGLGAEGAALAILTSYSIACLGLRFFSFTKLGIAPSLSLGKQIISAIITAFLLSELSVWYNLDAGDLRWYTLFLVSGLGAFLYFAFLSAIGGFKRADFDYLYDVINPFKMLSYVKEELKE